jgi:cell division protein FtsI/penicillin-binding protein 2
MSVTARKISMLASAMAASVCAVLIYLWFVMVEHHDTWLLRSCVNRCTFRDVPARRGSILDRQGRVLVHDEPMFELAVDYRQFRRNHVVGIAVHGANLLMQVTPGKEAVEFGYQGLRGPEEALQALLSLPLSWLRPSVLPKDKAADLRFYAVAVLSGLTGREPRRIQNGLLDAVRAGNVPELSRLPVGATSAELADTFAARLQSLRELEQEVLALSERDAQTGLLTRLEHLRADFQRDAEHAVEHRVTTVARDLDFELAARIGAGGDEYLGLRLLPGVRRVRAPACRESTLMLLLGSVGDLDRADSLDHLHERQALAMDEEDVEQLVPEEALPNELALSHFRGAARSAMSRLIRTSERQGITGIEETQDERLSGRPGLRLVEHDKRARELRLWSSLQVAPGSDLQLTLDVDLQQLVEHEAQECLQQLLQNPLAVPEKADVGIAILDAVTGDVLAVSGAPLRVTGTVVDEETDPETGDKHKMRRLVPDMLRGQPPGLGWRGSGDIGSLAKPFVAIEQLAAAHAGLPHTELSDFRECRGMGLINGVKLGCEKAHGPAGRDLKEAIAASCNNCFYQAAQGLGEAGVQRALSRVGLVEPKFAGSPLTEFTAMWQDLPVELPKPTTVGPKLDEHQGVLRRAIGYGVQASTVNVARAYAALCTGALPQTGLLLGQARTAVPLGIPDRDLDLVRDGLRACVKRGTASKVPGLQQWGVLGKTGTAEINPTTHANNAWFAGWLPLRGEGGVQLCFAAAVYCVPNGEHGAKVAGELVASVIAAIARDPELRRRYLGTEGPR